MVGSLTGAVTS